MEQQSEFCPICGYEQEYEWSPTLEAVRSVARMGTKGKIKQWQYDNYGRPFVQLLKNGVVRNFRKAALIYSHAHQCDILEGCDVHHIDFNKDNNDPSNLQLLTKEEHSKIHAEERSKAVVAVDENNRIVHRFASLMEAGRNGFDQGAVSKAARGCYNCKSDPHLYKGFRWYYEQDWLAMQAQQQQLAEPTIQVDAYGQMYFFV